MNYENFIEVVKARRTVRKYKPEIQLSKDEVYKIIEAGRYAPSGFNSQPWEYVVVQDETLRKEMVRFMQAAMQGKKFDELSPNMNVQFATAPTFIIIYGDSRVRDFGLPHVKASDDVWNFVLNTTLATAVQQMHLAAASLGLGAMWVSAIRKQGVDAKIKELLNIPEHMTLFELMAVGHADQINSAPRKLRSIEEMIHWDNSDKEDFRSYDELKKWFGK